MASSAYYYVTGAAGNQKTLTLSGWFKVCSFTDATFFSYHDQVSGSSARSEIYLNASSKLLVGINPSGSSWKELTYDNILRDPAGWYHIVVAYDTTQSTEADRVKVYINGNQYTAASGTYPSLNEDTGWNANGYQHTIGRYEVSDTMYLNGCVSHTHFIDGTAYAPTAFGEFDSTSGIWIAKTSPSVTYGDEGAFFKFASGALTTDSSGNGNTLTAVGTPTETKDSPDNNFCTMNPIVGNRSGFTWSNGNTKVVTASNSGSGATMGANLGKWYYEILIDSLGNFYGGWQDLSNEEASLNEFVPRGAVAMNNTPDIYYNGSGTAASSGFKGVPSFTTGDYIGCAIDVPNLKCWWSKNGQWYTGDSSTASTLTRAQVSANTNGFDCSSASTMSSTSVVSPFMGCSTTATTNSFNFGNGAFGSTQLTGTTYSDNNSQGVFKYEPPDGFRAICTNNIATYG